VPSSDRGYRRRSCVGFQALGSTASHARIKRGRRHGENGSRHSARAAPATAICCKASRRIQACSKRSLLAHGAAIVANALRSFGPQPAMSVTSIGYGAGTADLEASRTFCNHGWRSPGKAVRVLTKRCVIEANLDDMNRRFTAIFRKKRSRQVRWTCTHARADEKESSGTLLTCCAPHDTNSLMSLIFAETTRLVRTTAQRRRLPRELVSVTNKLWRSAYQGFASNGRILHARPEYDDCRKLALERTCASASDCGSCDATKEVRRGTIYVPLFHF